jgi:hypothetical protein
MLFCFQHSSLACIFVIAYEKLCVTLITGVYAIKLFSL